MTSISNEQIVSNIDTVWISMSTYLVFLMQAGFAFLEAGCVREKSVQNILIKNVLDICACTLVWWFVGYGFAYGDDKGNFIGESKFASEGFDGTNEYRDWMFQWAFAGTAATIVSGCLAERTQIIAYLIFSIFITAFIYPLVVHWTWGGGWLADRGYTDFAGSGIVHLVGGVAGLVGCKIVGPRLNRFNNENQDEFKPHNVPMVVLGTLILWFGWYGFNCGSTLSATGENEQLIGKVGQNTTLAAAAGGLICFIIHAIRHKGTKDRYNISPLTNGILAGLVSITAGCNGVEPYGALLIGIIGGFVYYIISNLLIKFKLDDPLDAFAVHGGSGAWGVIAVSFFDKSKGIFYGHSTDLLGEQLLGVFVISLWTFFGTVIIFGLLNNFNLLRISVEEEEKGIDNVEHGGQAYHITSGNDIEGGVKN